MLTKAEIKKVEIGFVPNPFDPNKIGSRKIRRNIQNSYFGVSNNRNNVSFFIMPNGQALKYRLQIDPKTGKKIHHFLTREEQLNVPQKNRK